MVCMGMTYNDRYIRHLDSQYSRYVNHLDIRHHARIQNRHQKMSYYHHLSVYSLSPIFDGNFFCDVLIL